MNDEKENIIDEGDKELVEATTGEASETSIIEDSKVKSSFKNRLFKNKVKIIAGILVILFISYITYSHFGIGMSEKTKISKINKIITTKNYDKARDAAKRYFNQGDSKEKALFDAVNSTISLCEDSNAGSVQEAMDKLKSNLEHISTIKIEKVDIKYGSSKYDDVEVTIRNTSKKDVNYVKINLFYKDSSGNIIESDWTNTSNCIRPNATTKLKKMVPKDLKYKTVSAEVASFR